MWNATDIPFILVSGGGRSLHCVVAKVLDCSFEVSKFEFHSRYYVHFRTNILGKGMNSLPSTYGLNNITTVLLQRWLWHQIAHKSWYVIKQRNWNWLNFTSVIFRPKPDVDLYIILINWILTVSQPIVGYFMPIS